MHDDDERPNRACVDGEGSMVAGREVSRVLMVVSAAEFPHRCRSALPPELSRRGVFHVKQSSQQCPHTSDSRAANLASGKRVIARLSLPPGLSPPPEALFHVKQLAQGGGRFTPNQTDHRGPGRYLGRLCGSATVRASGSPRRHELGQVKQ